MIIQPDLFTLEQTGEGIKRLIHQKPRLQGSDFMLQIHGVLAHEKITEAIWSTILAILKWMRDEYKLTKEITCPPIGAIAALLKEDDMAVSKRAERSNFFEIIKTSAPYRLQLTTEGVEAYNRLIKQMQP